MGDWHDMVDITTTHRQVLLRLSSPHSPEKPPQVIVAALSPANAQGLAAAINLAALEVTRDQNG